MKAFFFFHPAISPFSSSFLPFINIRIHRDKPIGRDSYQNLRLFRMKVSDTNLEKIKTQFSMYLRGETAYSRGDKYRSRAEEQSWVSGRKHTSWWIIWLLKNSNFLPSRGDVWRTSKEEKTACETRGLWRHISSEVKSMKAEREQGCVAQKPP